MKKNYIKYILAGFVSFSGAMHCIESEQNQVDPISVSITPTPALSHNTTAITTIEVNSPILVPFNFNLYQSCCEQRQSNYQWSCISKCMTIVIGAFALGSALSSLSSPVVLCKEFLTNFIAYRWYWKIHAIGYKVFQAFSMVSLIGSLAHASKTIATDFDNHITWENREALVALLKQQIWHNEIYTRLGKPTIEGSIPTTGTYHIIGEKKFGAGKIIFDPFDQNQVKILLGIHETMTEDLRCKKITIVPSVEPSINKENT